MDYISTNFFPEKFLTKLFNFEKQTLVNLHSLWESALDHFKNNQLKMLDPLVCENSCHIRALITDNLTRKLKDNYYKKQFHQVFDSLIMLKQKLSEHIIEKNAKNHSIADFLIKNNLFFHVNPEIFTDIKYIIHCYILTLTKKEYPSMDFTLHEKTCHEQLLQTGLVHNKVKCFVLESQKELSEISCKILLSLIKDDNNLIDVTKDNHGRCYLPQHISGKIVLSEIIKSKKTIGLKVSRYLQGNIYDNMIFFFKYNDHTHTINPIKTISFDEPCIIFSGVVNYENIPETKIQYLHRLEKFSLDFILEANFAAHPQFSGSLKGKKCIYDDVIEHNTSNNQLYINLISDYKSSKKFAETHGCTKEKPTLLFLNHIYCDMPHNYIQEDRYINTELHHMNLIDDFVDTNQ